VSRFREVTFAAFDDQPGDGQSSFLVDHTDHQGQTLTPYFAAIHSQQQGGGSQARQQDVDVRQEVDFRIDPLMADPAREAFDTALFLGSIRHFGGYCGQIGALAAHDAAD
jgi:hypothetical protein